MISLLRMIQLVLKTGAETAKSKWLHFPILSGKAWVLNLNRRGLEFQLSHLLAVWLWQVSETLLNLFPHLICED